MNAGILLIVGLFAITLFMALRMVFDRQKLSDAENKVRAVAEAVGEGIVLIDPDFRMKFVNRELCSIFGYSQEQLLGQGIKTIIPGYTGISKENRPDGDNSGDSGILVETEGIGRNKAVIPLELRIKEDSLRENGVNLTIITVINISNRIKAEETLKKLESSVEQTTDMIIITNLEGIIEYANPAVEEATGYSRTEIIGKTNSIFKSGKHDGSFYKNMWETITSGKIWHGQLINKKKSGKFYDEEMTISPIYNKSGEPTHYVAIKRNITDSKKLRQQLIHAEKLSSIGTFVSGVAHELNNPLTVVVGFAKKLIKYENLPDNIMEELKIIVEQSERTAGIVRNLLTFSRKYKPGKTSLRINNVVKGTLNLQTYRFRTDNIKIESDYGEELPPVMADNNQLQQVFMNIILNAHHAMTKARGRGVLTVKTEKAGNDINITFHNDGPAIPEKTIEKIFEPFYTSKGIGEGTGLGLYISHEIIEDHKGKISVENDGESGVRFTITLPAVTGSAKENKMEPEKAKVINNVKVLLVEDEETIRQWVTGFLSDAGMEVLSAKDGNEAVELLHQNEFDVILSDFKMPVMDGMELGKWLQVTKPEYMARFILATGSIETEVDDFCSRYGCISMAKPLDESATLDTIFRVAGKARGGKSDGEK